MIAFQKEKLRLRNGCLWISQSTMAFDWCGFERANFHRKMPFIWNHLPLKMAIFYTIVRLRCWFSGIYLLQSYFRATHFSNHWLNMHCAQMFKCHLNWSNSNCGTIWNEENMFTSTSSGKWLKNKHEIRIYGDEQRRHKWRMLRTRIWHGYKKWWRLFSWQSLRKLLAPKIGYDFFFLRLNSSIFAYCERRGMLYCNTNS